MKTTDNQNKRARFVSAYIQAFQKGAVGEFASTVSPQNFGDSFGSRPAGKPSISISVPPEVAQPKVVNPAGAFAATEGAAPFAATQGVARFDTQKGMAPFSATQPGPDAGVMSIDPAKPSLIDSLKSMEPDFLKGHEREAAIAGAVGIGGLGLLGLYHSRKKSEEQKRKLQQQALI